MFNEIIIDNKTYKIMKYLYGKKGVHFSDIQKKFGEDESMMVRELCRGKYAAIRLPDGTLTQETSFLPYNCQVCLLVPGNKYVEDRRASSIVRMVPILVSIASLLVSILSIVISTLSNRSELFVHLLK